MSILVYFSILGADAKPRRVPILCPSGRHSIKLLRIQAQHKLANDSPSSKRLCIFFNGKELKDSYTIGDYDINNEDVLHITLMDKHTIKAQVKHEAIEPASRPPSVECDDYFQVGDHLDVYHDTSRSWFPAILVAIVPKDTSPTEYFVNFVRASLGSDVCRCLAHLRPQSTRAVSFSQLLPGMRVFVCIDRLWHVGVVVSTKLDKRSKFHKPWGRVKLNVVDNNDQHPWRQQIVKYREDHFFHLESNVLRHELSAEQLRDGDNKQRQFQVDCELCRDDHRVSQCASCACHVCTHKKHDQPRLVCNDCHQMIHVHCLPGVASNLWKRSEWYCAKCRNDDTCDGIEIRNQTYLDRRKARRTEAQNWGHGMACAGRTASAKTMPNLGCTFGRIENVPVGTWWRFRVQASEAGVHAPLVAGVHGRQSLGVYSLVFAGAYDEDVDLGNDLYYSAIGGRRDEPPAKRAKYRIRLRQEPLVDQGLEGVNRALAISCAAPFHETRGADANVRWREGTPIRVLRSGNGRRSKAERSLYLPAIGVRYDGLYKVVKYWPELTSKQTCLWRFHLRRDDPEPAPWTEQGRYRARKLRLELIYPPGWCKEMSAKRNSKVDDKLLIKKERHCRE